MPDNIADDPQNALLYQIPIARKDEFLKFVKEGKPLPGGGFEVDENGNQITGVIAWLNNESGKHRIYTVETDESFVFITTTSSNGDWSKIPAFEGLFGANTRTTLNHDLNGPLTL